ncbi:MAG: terpene synthase family protein [Elainellaceae cyanobacterium]
MFNKSEIRHYVELYRIILTQHHIAILECDLDAIYTLIVLTFQLDDLYDLDDTLPTHLELAPIKTAMVSQIPNSHAIGIKSIESLFQAMHEETVSDLSQSLDHYLSVCRKSIGAQLISGYLASKENIVPDIWFSPFIAQINNDMGDIIRLANDYLDMTVDQSRVDEEKTQLKSAQFFRSKLEFKYYLYCRLIVHKFHYHTHLIRFEYLNLSASSHHYLKAIHCAESVLDLAIKAYIFDKKSGRSQK